MPDKPLITNPYNGTVLPVDAWTLFQTVQQPHGSFSDSTDQPIPTGSTIAATFDTTELSNGVSVVSGSRLTVAAPGTYAFDLSPQLVLSGGTGNTITFWAAVNGTAIPRSASSLEMGNNNSRTLPFVRLFVPMTAGQYLEWYFTASNTGVTLEHFAAQVGPPAIPDIPSVIANVQWVSA